MDRVNAHKVLPDYQHGFRFRHMKFRHSCDTQLINAFKDLAEGLNDHQQMDPLILDFFKAFDMVAH